MGSIRAAGNARVGGNPSGVTSHHLDHSLGDPHALRAVVGTALFLTVLGALGTGLGALIRNTAGGISAFVGLLFVLPGITASYNGKATLDYWTGNPWTHGSYSYWKVGQYTAFAGIEGAADMISRFNRALKES